MEKVIANDGICIQQVKHVSIDYMLFDLSCGYHLCVMFENEIYLHLGSLSANKKAKKLKKLILICQQNLLYAQGL